jgi:hypothetical protein
MAVAVSKKHLPGLVQRFDPNDPKDYDGLLRLLSFQTGHNPSTHAGAYALPTYLHATATIRASFALS